MELGNPARDLKVSSLKELLMPSWLVASILLPFIANLVMFVNSKAFATIEALNVLSQFAYLGFNFGSKQIGRAHV